MNYEDLIFKIPIESETYQEDSNFIVKQIISILDERKNQGDDKIILNTNLKLGLPLENINKFAFFFFWQTKNFTIIFQKFVDSCHKKTSLNFFKNIFSAIKKNLRKFFYGEKFFLFTNPLINRRTRNFIMFHRQCQADCVSRKN